MTPENELAKRLPAKTPWWRSPRVFWLAATGASLVIIAISVFAGVAGDEDNASTSAESTEESTTDTPAASPTVTAEPTATVVPPSSVIGPPPDILWPSIDDTPLEEWPATPSDAASAFVAELTGYELPVGSVTEVEGETLISRVSLQSVGEDGEPFGEATVVTVAGGVDRSGARHWGVRAVQSELIRVDAWSFSEPPVNWQPSGEGLAFEGTITTQISTANFDVVGLYFVTGGGVELAPLSGEVPITPTAGGPGFAALFDIGGLGMAPTALTVVPLEIPVVEAPGASSAQPSGACSAAELELSDEALEDLNPPAEPDAKAAENGDEHATLPSAVASTRRLIVEAAIACDYEALAGLMSPAGFSFSFGSGADPIEFWRELEAEGEDQPTRRLVETLLLPHGVDPLGDEPLYVWPDAFLFGWEDTTEAQRNALAEVYDAEAIEGFESFGAFIGYRVGITESGNWIYFIAGD